MPITIGKKPESSFADPLGLLSDCHRRIEHFLGLLITVTAGARGGALSGEQRDALVTAGRYFRDAAPLHKEDEERSLFPRMRESRDTQVHAALATIEELKEDHVVLDRGHVEVDALIERWMDDDSCPQARGSVSQPYSMSSGRSTNATSRSKTTTYFHWRGGPWIWRRLRRSVEKWRPAEA